jgi:hypothetical protein
LLLPFALQARTVVTEVEPNQDKTTATPSPVGGLATGDMLVGAIANTDSPDYFRVKTAIAPLGIYRHRLHLAPSGPEGGTVDASIRGLSRISGGTSGADVEIQNSTTETALGFALLNQWYGFGRGEEVYYQVSSSDPTAVSYQTMLESTPVMEVFAGPFVPGPIKISAKEPGHLHDTDMWVYNSDFTSILFGSDNATMGNTGPEPSEVTRNLASGTYHIAISEYDLAAPGLLHPSDGGWGRDQREPDFDNVILQGGPYSPVMNLDVSIWITDSSGTPQMVPLFRQDLLDVVFVSFTVVPEPSGAIVGFALLSIVGNRRRSHR